MPSLDFKTERATIPGPNQEYHKIAALSNSSIKPLLVGYDSEGDPELCPKALYDKWQANEAKEPSDAMIWGSAVDCALTEPDKLDKFYCELPKLDETKRPQPDKDYKTKENRQWKADQLAAIEEKVNGRDTIKAEKWDAIRTVRDNCFKRRDIRLILETMRGQSPYYWTDEATGLPMKKLKDGEIEGHLTVEIKTVRDASEDFISKEILYRLYHVQAGIYCNEGPGQTKDHAFIFIQNEPPFGIVYKPSARRLIEHGQEIFRKMINVVAECNDRGKWPFRLHDGIVADLPAWYWRKLNF